MKTCYLLIISLIFLSCQQNQNKEKNTEFSENEPEKVLEEKDSRLEKITSIEDIQQEYQNTINHKSLDSTSFKYNCYEKSGHVTYFKDQEDLRLIKHAYNEASHFSATEYFYINDNELFFALYEEVSWVFDDKAKEPGNTKDNITEKRYYFIEDALVKCLEKKFVIRSVLKENLTSVDVPNQEKNCPQKEIILDDFQTLVKYKEQRVAIECLTL